eukprot:14746584-Alexandrium_andersonii.AAC.1
MSQPPVPRFLGLPFHVAQRCTFMPMSSRDRVPQHGSPGGPAFSQGSFADFASRDLNTDAAYGPYHTLTAHRVRGVIAPEGEPEFPSRPECIRVNETFGGFRHGRDPA